MTAVWRTLFGRTLAGWMILVVATTLGAGAIIDHVASDAVGVLLLLIFLGAPFILLLWMAVVLLRAPRTYWPTLVALIVFCGAYALVALPLLKAGLYLNLLPYRADYEAVIAAEKASRLPVTWRRGGCFGGAWRGVRYQSTECQDEVFFPWSDVPSSLLGVVYSESDCPRPKDEPEPRRPPLNPLTGLEDSPPPMMKNAGKLGSSFHISGHYCLLWVVF